MGNRKWEEKKEIGKREREKRERESKEIELEREGERKR